MRFSLREYLHVIFCTAVVGLAPAASAQQLQTPAAQRAPQSAEVLTQPAEMQLRAGVEHEQNERWLEAIQHYEAATRKFPDHAELKRRLLISRLHYDVLRRCLDVTMADNLKQTAPQDVLELYSEVLARLEMSYVDPLEMTQLVRGGTAYLEVALTEPKFIAALPAQPESPSHRAVQNKRTPFDLGNGQSPIDSRPETLWPVRRRQQKNKLDSIQPSPSCSLCLVQWVYSILILLFFQRPN